MFKNCYEITISCVETYRMKISLLTIFLFMSAASLTSVSARVWKESENGQVLWDDNCHFVGYVMGPPRPSGADECGRICLAYGAGPQARPPCTHANGTSLTFMNISMKKVVG